ncbi:MAG: hypothetical protein ACOYEV_00880 [Candidatus Nanopelagicales bacterium]
MSADVPADDDLEQWPFATLRHAAFERARQRLDLGFFTALIEHTPALEKTMTEGGSLGDIAGTISELYEGAHQAFSDDPGEREPLFRAVFADYLRVHGLPAH